MSQDMYTTVKKVNQKAIQRTVKRFTLPISVLMLTSRTHQSSLERILRVLHTPTRPTRLLTRRHLLCHIGRQLRVTEEWRPIRCA